MDNAKELVDLSLREVSFLGRGRDHQTTGQLDLVECLVVAKATVQGLWHSWSPGGDVLRHEATIVSTKWITAAALMRQFEANPCVLPAQGVSTLDWQT